MKKSPKEKVIASLIQYAKRHRAMKYPALAIMTCYLCVDYIWCFLKNNPKRLTGIGLALAFFVIGSSFAFPKNEQEEELQTEEYTVTYADVPESINIEETSEMEDFNDMDIIEEIGGMDFDSDIEIDRYSADDILEQNYDCVSKKEDTKVLGEEERFSKEDWNLVLINKQHPVPDDYEFTLGNLTGSVQCDERIFEDLLAMLQAAREDGVNLMVCSSYRDENRQQLLFERKIKKYMQCGMSYAEAYRKTSSTVTVPGASEHQIGLALDIVTGYHTSLNEAFGDTEAGIWLRDYSYQYGFILRYPQGKEDITGISYEPWHFRYVGVNAATIMKEKELTLEEFVDTECDR